MNGTDLYKFATAEQRQPRRSAADQESPDVTIAQQRWSNSSQQQESQQTRPAFPPKASKPATYISMLSDSDIDVAHDVTESFYVTNPSGDYPQALITQSCKQFDRLSLGEYVVADNHGDIEARRNKELAKKKAATLDIGRRPPAAGGGVGGEPKISPVMSPASAMTPLPARTSLQQQRQPLSPPTAVGRRTDALMTVPDSPQLPPLRSDLFLSTSPVSKADSEDSGNDSSSISRWWQARWHRQQKPPATAGKNKVTKRQQPSNLPSDATMKNLRRYSWYIGDASREQAENQVKRDGQDGSFVARNSRNGGPGKPYTLTIYHQSHIYNIQIRYLPELGGLFAVGSEKVNELRFESLEHVVRHYHINPIELVRPADGPDARSISVTLQYKR
jgi:hypothetical protein